MPIARPLEEQDERESQKLWHSTVLAIKDRDHVLATDEKTKIEDRQREETAKRTEKGVEWQPTLFRKVRGGPGGPEEGEEDLDWILKADMCVYLELSYGKVTNFTQRWSNARSQNPADPVDSTNTPWADTTTFKWPPTAVTGSSTTGTAAAATLTTANRSSKPAETRNYEPLGLRPIINSSATSCSKPASDTIPEHIIRPTAAYAAGNGRSDPATGYHHKRCR